MMEDLSLHILDIAENAVAAGATRVRIAVNENERRDVLTFRVTDNGRGMPPEEKARALDPFFTTGRKRTGLGLPLLAQTAEHCGGRLTLISAPGRGTRVVARFGILPRGQAAADQDGRDDDGPFLRPSRDRLSSTGTPVTDCVSASCVAARSAGMASPAEIAGLGEALRSGLGRIGAS